MKHDLDMIIKLMEELKDGMEYGEEDFNERLGKQKPEVEVLKVEGEMPLKKGVMEEGCEEDEMDHEFDEDSGSFFAKNDPEESLKKRVMKLRG